MRIINKLRYNITGQIIPLVLILLLLSCTNTVERNERFESLIAQGDSLFTQGQFDDSMALYLLLTSQYPDSLSLDFRLYKCYMAVGLVDRANEVLRLHRNRNEREYDPGFWSWYYSLSAIAVGDSLLLSLHTDTLLAIANEDNPESWRQAAFNEVFLKKYELAIGHYEKYVIYGEPDETPPNLGFLYLKVGKQFKGQEILNKADSLVQLRRSQDPEDFENYFELAEYASMRGNVDQSIEYMREALDKGLDKKWWFLMLSRNNSIPDPVFESLFADSIYLNLRTPVIVERNSMRANMLKLN